MILRNPEHHITSLEVSQTLQTDEWDTEVFLRPTLGSHVRRQVTG